VPVRAAGILVAAVLLAPAVARGAANVSSSGCHTTVTTEIEIFGAGASKAVAKKIRNGILGCSPGKVGGYSLLGCCKVNTQTKVRVRRKGKGPRPGYNQIEITNEADFRSYVDGGRDSGKWGSTESGEVYAHEAGHLLGLDDQYDDRTDADGNTVSVTRPGHEMDKMGAPGGKLGIGGAARGSLDSLLLSKGARCNPTKCCRRSTTTTIPPGTWTGTFHYVYTDDEVGTGSTPTEVDTRDDHLRIEGTWTITSTTGGDPPEVILDSSWMGSYSLMKNDTYQRTFCVGYEDLSIMTSITGSGTGTQQFGIYPTDPDPNQFTFAYIPPTPLNVIQLTGGTHRTQCNTPPSDTAASGTVDDSVTAMLAALPILTPDPGNPNHYAGRNTSSHVEMPGIGGAPHVIDSYVEWDLVRHGR
jgi:hypothetical protein